MFILKGHKSKPSNYVTKAEKSVGVVDESFNEDC